MRRVTLHVPLLTNDGARVPGILAAVESRLQARGIDSWTRVEAHGGWRGQTEPMMLYMVDTTDIHGARERIRHVGEFVKVAMDQEAVYLTTQYIETELIT
jgi:hypothetical protein